MNPEQSSATSSDTLRSDGDVESLKRRTCELLEQQHESETAFAQQRAKFMDLFKQKEEELRSTQEQLAKAESERTELAEQVTQLRAEVEDVKTAAAIQEFRKEDEIAKARRQHEEELASFQQIMEEAVSETRQSATSKYEAEHVQWLRHQADLEAELHKLRAKLSHDREGFLTSLTKTLQKHVPVGATSRDTQDNLEYSMKRAQEDAELLKSVVSPLEEEIINLKAQLDEARAAAVRASVKVMSDEECSDSAAVNTDNSHYSTDDKIRELNLSLDTEKASRTDLEMYVGVLNTQKTTLVDEADALRGQLSEVRRSLDQERLDHSSLKRTWQMANDQFLASHCQMLADVRRMESVLTAEQKCHIAEMKTKESTSESKVDKLEPAAVNTSETTSQPSQDVDGQTETTASATDVTDLDDVIPPSSPEQDSQTQSDRPGGSDMLSVQTASLSPSALVDGKRLVSETEWQLLHREMNAAREKIGQRCELCAHYEAQMQSAQASERQALVLLHAVERQLELERQTMDKQRNYVTELESNLQNVSEQSKQQIAVLDSKQRESDRFLLVVKQQLVQAQRELFDDLQQLMQDREDVQKELTRLQDENNSLVGKHSKHSQEMQDEAIDLPSTVEEMQLAVLKYREDLITAKVGQEHGEELLRSEIMFLRDQIVAEQQERSTMEENLAQEISQLQQQLAVCSSLNTELEREKVARVDAENKQKELQATDARQQQKVLDLESQIRALEAAKAKMEADVQLQRLKVSSLQTDLENSEAVQRDFVKLSQSLQIQLEKIRASENEVRWQHEEDVDDCSHCKQSFSVTRRKHHCRHCGQIFCVDCLSKSVHSGPHRRPARVCDVCHTILVRDATPYFCTDTLHTPE